MAWLHTNRRIIRGRLLRDAGVRFESLTLREMCDIAVVSMLEGCKDEDARKQVLDYLGLGPKEQKVKVSALPDRLQAMARAGEAPDWYGLEHGA